MLIDPPPAPSAPKCSVLWMFYTKCQHLLLLHTVPLIILVISRSVTHTHTLYIYFSESQADNSCTRQYGDQRYQEDKTRLTRLNGLYMSSYDMYEECQDGFITY